MLFLSLILPIIAHISESFLSDLLCMRCAISENPCNFVKYMTILCLWIKSFMQATPLGGFGGRMA